MKKFIAQRLYALLVAGMCVLSLSGLTASLQGPRLASGSVGPASPQADGDLEPGFAPSVFANGTVDSLAVQTDGKIVIGGSFSTVNGTVRSRITRLNADGTLDTAFANGQSGPNNNVNALALQTDGKIVIGGLFTTVNGVTRNRIARLNADGTLDTTFANGLAGANNTLLAVAAQTDGKVIIGGDFTTVNGTTRNRVARLNADGTLDTAFANGLTGTDTTVQAVAAQADGKVIIGGAFTTVNGTTSNRIARLNADGTLDTGFANGQSGASGTVFAVALQGDGKVVIGGTFTTVNGVTRNNITRLNADGTLDTTFANGLTGANSTVNTVAVQTDGKIVLGGGFTSVNGTARTRIARLNADGTLDTGFDNGVAGANNIVRTVAVGGNGKVAIGGFFTTISGAARNNIAQLNADGTLDTAFNASAFALGSVFIVAAQPDGKVVIGGNFNFVNSTARNFIARLNADGTTDTAFANGQSGANNTVNALAVQTDGKIIIGGAFTSLNGVVRSRIARLNADGTLDTAFANGLAGANNTVFAAAVQTDGKILIGGDFTSVNGVARGNIARLNADGTLDTTFGNGLAGAVGGMRAVAVQTDGKVLIGGLFTTVNGTTINRVARLNADGTTDTAFANGLAGANSTVQAVAVQPDGKIVIGGAFTTVNGTTSNRVARLNADGTLDTAFGSGQTGANNTILALALQTDGKVVIVGNFATVNGVTRNFIARLNADGTLDTGFANGQSGASSTVFTVALQIDRKIVVGGNFLTVNGATRAGVARFLSGFTISGRLADDANLSLAGVSVGLTGAVSQVVTSDQNGNYSFMGLPIGGNYTVVPSSPAYTFTPARADFTNLTADQTQNFTAPANSVPPDRPPLMDGFPPLPNPDPAVWNLGVVTQPPGSFNPSVTVSQQTGQLVITPAANQTGYNGYVALSTIDLTGGLISVELPQAGSGGSQAIFSLGTDFNNYIRFVVQSPMPNQPLRIQEVINGKKQAPYEANMTMLMFQLAQNGQIVLNVAIPYDPTAHRFLRFRHVTRDANQNPINAMAFETSAEASTWPERARANLGERPVTGLTVELAGGTNTNASSPSPIIFDNLLTQVVNGRFTAAAVTANEGDGQVTLTVQRTGLTNLATSLEYSTTDGTASQRSRYVAAAGVLNFAAGETSKTIQILLVDDALVQGPQTFNVFLGPGVGMGVNGPGRTIVTINDNDNPPITSNPLETPTYFVSRQYYDFLSRVPDGPGLDFWANEITGPCNGNAACISQRRWQVSLAFFVELEFQQTGSYVYRLYRAAYGNNQPFPNPSGDNLSQAYCLQTGCPFRAAHIPSYQRFVADRARVVGSQNLAADQLALANVFVNRAEFRQRYPTTQTAAQFVDALLATIQTASGVNLSGQRDALIALHDTGGRGAVLYRLADDNTTSNPINNRVFIDAEYNRGFVLTQYFGYLRRDPDMPGLNFWRDVVNLFPLRNATGQSAMVCAFVTSQEYQERFSLTAPRSNSECPPAP